MTSINLYTVRDKVAEKCGPVFQCVNDAVALREFQKVMLKVPDISDYELLYLGTFDEVTGMIVSEPVPTLIDATSMINKVVNKMMEGNLK